MKIKRCGILLILLLLLTGCKQSNEPADLVITIPEPCTTGTLTVYGAGVKEFQYAGEIDIRNDGRNGEPIEIIIQAGDDNE